MNEKLPVKNSGISRRGCLQALLGGGILFGTDVPEQAAVCLTEQGRQILRWLIGRREALAEPATRKVEALPSAPGCELLPNYPVSNKVAVIIEGASEDSRHPLNTTRAIRTLGDPQFGFTDFFVAQDHPLDSPKHPVDTTGLNIRTFFSDEAGVDKLIDALPLQKDTLVFFYVTGHGDQEKGDACFALNAGPVERAKGMPHYCYPLSAMTVKLQKMKAAGARGFFVTDTCYSGAMPDAIIGSGIEGAAMSPGSLHKETASLFFAIDFFANMRQCVDINGDGVSEANEWFAASMAGYQLKMNAMFGEAFQDGHFAQSRIRLTPQNFRETLQNPKVLVVNVGNSSCGFDCFAHSEVLNQAMGILGEQMRVVDLDADSWGAKRIFAAMRVTPSGKYPATIIRQADGAFKMVPGTLKLDDLLRTLKDLAGVRRDPKVWRPDVWKL